MDDPNQIPLFGYLSDEPSAGAADKVTVDYWELRRKDGKTTCYI